MNVKVYWKKGRGIVMIETKTPHSTFQVLALTILATRDTQFGQEVALVMQTTHAQHWQYPGRVD